jgi:acetate kinase
MSPTILVLNAGSSSLKLGLFAVTHPATAVAQGVVRRICSDAGILDLEGFRKAIHRDALSCPDHATALHHLLDALTEIDPAWVERLHGIGHRVVHGGSAYTRPTMITPQAEAALDALTELAPLHNGRAIDVLKAALELLPGVPQVACFDTMFHAQLPEETARYALPRDISDRYRIRRYGFHGLSCEWSMSRLRQLEGRVPEHVVICHLGAGASVTAVSDGHSVDTTMGFTPLEGLIMATRSGSIDPSIVLYLLRHAGMSPDDMERMLERESGMFGLSGESGDVEILEDLAEKGNPNAGEALSAFAYKVRAAIGAFWAILGGLDTIVLTGGIAEYSSAMRRRILQPLRPLGVELDEAANRKVGGTTEGKISVPDRKPIVWMVAANEQHVIAEQVQALLG